MVDVGATIAATNKSHDWQLFREWCGLPRLRPGLFESPIKSFLGTSFDHGILSLSHFCSWEVKVVLYLRLFDGSASPGKVYYMVVQVPEGKSIYCGGGVLMADGVDTT